MEIFSLNIIIILYLMKIFPLIICFSFAISTFLERLKLKDTPYDPIGKKCLSLLMTLNSTK
jgi:hypothetical protein